MKDVKVRNVARGWNGSCSGKENWESPGIDLVEGENLITIRMEDENGEYTATEFRVTYTGANLEDTEPPTVEITGPTDQATPATYHTLRRVPEPVPRAPFGCERIGPLGHPGDSCTCSTPS